MPPRAAGARQKANEDTLRTYLATILGSWPLVATIMLLALMAGAIFYATATPIYRTTALVQIEDKKSMTGLDELSNLMATQSPAETEIQVLTSRFLLGTVVDALKLDIDARPRYFPVIGKAIARRRHVQEPAPPLLGRYRYAWGGERVQVTNFEVAPQWLGRAFTLVVRDNGNYDLYAPSRGLFGPPRELVATGVVGQPSTPASGVAAPPTLLVQELVARPGTEFVLTRSSRLRSIENLQRSLSVTEKGKKSGVLFLSLEGESPGKIASILDTAESAYLRQNIELKSAEAEKTLQFIERQLPELRNKLEAAEAALSDYQTRTGTLDVSKETNANLNQAAEVEKGLTELRLQMDEAKSRFTGDHPAMRVLGDKVKRLEAQRRRLETSFRGLPTSELESARLLRDVRVAQDLYVLLLNKSQELKVIKSGTIGTVRILDVASVPDEPVAPKIPLVLISSVLGGLLLGVGAAFAKQALNMGVQDPELIESDLGLPTYASIPHSEIQSRRAKRRRRTGIIPPLAATHPNDLAIEAIRSMRTGLQFALLEARNNVVAIGGPSPGIGKSFVSVNLAHVMAAAGQRILIIDADLRKGHLHDYFGADRGKGLADLIAEGGDPAELVRESTTTPNLHFMSMGTRPTQPSELLGSGRYEEILTWASGAFDIVVVDCAPVLAVTDGVLAARVAGVCLLVLRSGQHPMREITAALSRFEHARIDIKAAIFNDVKQGLQYGYYGKYGYTYQYDYR